MGRRTLSKKLVKLAEVDASRAQHRYEELSGELRNAEAQIFERKAELATFESAMADRAAQGMSLAELMMFESEQASLVRKVEEAQQTTKVLERGVVNEMSRLLSARQGVDRAEKVNEKVEGQENKKRQRVIQRSSDDRAGRKGWGS